jgi:hypothetical protein
MVPDVYGLVRRDHDDLDRALVVMADPTTATDELAPLLDIFRLALSVHVAAEAKVFATLLEAVARPDALRRVVAEAREEHAEQHRLVDALGAARPGSERWYALVLELRVLVLDHATRAELARWTLQDLEPLVHRRLAHDYATERMRVLARTSPMALARAALLVHV